MTRSRIVTVLSSVFIFLLCVLLPACLNAEEIIDKDFEYSLDIPEGYKVAGYTPDGMSYQFKHSFMPVELVLKLYSTEVFPDSKNALEGALSKLGAKYDEIDTFVWRNAACAIAIFDSNLIMKDGATGWSVAVTLPEKNYNLVLLCYADSAKANDCEQFILSTLNSLCIDKGSKYNPGIITTYAYPATSSKTVNLNIAGKRITTTMDADDSDANNFIIDCEFAVLKLYANHEKWKEAWTRYYKTIYRDSYSRLEKAAFEINAALYPLAVRKNPKNAEEELNAMLLNWVQSFDYKRGNKTSSDFTSVVDSIAGIGSDCDSRSMLMCILLRHNGIKTELFVSREYSHAVYGADILTNGAKINVDGTDYLLGETTVKNLKPGLIAQEQSDTEKWIPIRLDN